MTEYNDVQCDKRNSYRHRVKQEKAAATVTDKDDEDDAGEAATVPVNGEANGHAEAEGIERPAKKLKAESGKAVSADPDGMDDDADDAEQDGDQDGDDGEDGEEGADDEPEDEDVPDDDEADEDEAEGVANDDEGVRGGLRDEALDDVDSD